MTEEELKEMEAAAECYSDEIEELERFGRLPTRAEMFKAGWTARGERDRALQAAQAREAELAAVLNHIVAMKHLTPGGSTEGWAKEVLIKFDLVDENYGWNEAHQRSGE